MSDLTADVVVIGMSPGGDASTQRTSRSADLDGVTGRVVRFDVESSSGGNTGAVEARILAPVG